MNICFYLHYETKQSESSFGGKKMQSQELIASTGWNPAEWAQKQFGGAYLGDRRRTKTLVEMGEAIIRHPDAPLPQQMGNWNRLKRAYGLLRNDKVTFEEQSRPVWGRTREEAERRDIVLIIQDTTQLDYTKYNRIKGLGPIGNGKGRGMLLHSALAVDPNEKEVLGMMYQKVFLRKPAPAGEKSSYERQKRKRESEVWKETVARINRPLFNDETVWVHVCDRGSDTFEFMEACRREGVDFLIRICQNRVIEIVDEATHEQVKGHLLQYARTLPPQTSWEVEVKGTHGRQARITTVNAGWAPVSIQPPFHRKGRGEPIPVWVIRVWEAEEAPTGEEPLEWVLVTSVGVTNAEEVRERVFWYENRWLVEDYHQCLKTGCRMEERALGTAQRLMRLLAVLSPVAVFLLQLREYARWHPERLAALSLPPELVRIVAYLGKMDSEQMTTLQFWHQVARLGGYLGREGDGPPGWKTLWRGWNYLLILLEGIKLADLLYP